MRITLELLYPLFYSSFSSLLTLKIFSEIDTFSYLKKKSQSLSSFISSEFKFSPKKKHHVLLNSLKQLISESQKIYCFAATFDQENENSNPNLKDPSAKLKYKIQFYSEVLIYQKKEVLNYIQQEKRSFYSEEDRKFLTSLYFQLHYRIMKFFIGSHFEFFFSIKKKSRKRYKEIKIEIKKLFSAAVTSALKYPFDHISILSVEKELNVRIFHYFHRVVVDDIFDDGENKMSKENFYNYRTVIEAKISFILGKDDDCMLMSYAYDKKITNSFLIENDFFLFSKKIFEVIIEGKELISFEINRHENIFFESLWRRYKQENPVGSRRDKELVRFMFLPHEEIMNIEEFIVVK